ncbi:MAG: PepSY-associated TM helix domain-containing protein, partial [Burkholderiales bacterium]
MSSTELPTGSMASSNKATVGAVTIKSILLKVHRWLALSVGIVIMISAVTGVLLTVGKPLDRIVNASLFVGGQQQVPYQAFVDAVRTTYGKDTQVRLRFPAESGGTIQAYVKTKTWDGSAYFDAATATLVGSRAKDEGFYNFIFELHSDLFLHDVGEVVLTVAGTAFVIMLITGLFLWWPRKWRFAFRVNLKGNATALLFDGHRVAGALFGLFVLVNVFTGTYLVWKPIATWVTAMAGQTPNKPPVLPKDPARKLL